MTELPPGRNCDVCEKTMEWSDDFYMLNMHEIFLEENYCVLCVSSIPDKFKLLERKEFSMVEL